MKSTRSQARSLLCALLAVAVAAGSTGCSAASTDSDTDSALTGPGSQKVAGSLSPVLRKNLLSLHDRCLKLSVGECRAVVQAQLSADDVRNIRTELSGIVAAANPQMRAQLREVEKVAHDDSATFVDLAGDASEATTQFAMSGDALEVFARLGFFVESFILLPVMLIGAIGVGAYCLFANCNHR